MENSDKQFCVLSVHYLCKEMYSKRAFEAKKV